MYCQGVVWNLMFFKLPKILDESTSRFMLYSTCILLIFFKTRMDVARLSPMSTLALFFCSWVCLWTFCIFQQLCNLCLFCVCVMLVNDFLSDTIFQVMKILQVTHRTVFYQMITINPGMYKVTHTATVVQGEGWWSPPPPPWGFVLLQQCEINLHWLHSPELALQVDTIFYWLHVWVHIDFWLNIHEICGYHGNIRSNRHNWHIKISAEGDWTATESFSHLE